MVIEKSLWERIGAFDSGSATARERFARKYDRLAGRDKPAVGGHRTDSFTFSDLYAQDAPATATRKAA